MKSNRQPESKEWGKKRTGLNSRKQNAVKQYGNYVHKLHEDAGIPRLSHSEALKHAFGLLAEQPED